MAVGDGASGADEPDLEAEVVSAVGEAFNNIVLHGFRGLPPRPLQIEVDWSDERLTVTLTDEGETFDPSVVTPPDLDALPEHGMGIFIMRACMDEIDYRPGPPNITRLVKLRRRRSADPVIK
jgi:serine/threonine-protein kinase RsbW